MSWVFAWDPRKARSNYRKHRVSFTEATTVFNNPLAQIFADPDHSEEESRGIIIGHSAEQNLLLVCFTELEMDQIRIISARRATKREQYEYEEHVAN